MALHKVAALNGDDHVRKLVHVENETVKKLLDIRTAALQAGVEIHIPENCIQNVSDFKQLALRAGQDRLLQQKLQYVLKLSEEQWEEASEHAARAVKLDNRMRAWYLDRRTMEFGLLFRSHIGSVDLDGVVAVLHCSRTGGQSVTEATLVQNFSPAQHELVRQLRPQAIHSWRLPGQPGWAPFPVESEHYERTGQLVAATNWQPEVPTLDQPAPPPLAPMKNSLIPAMSEQQHQSVPGQPQLPRSTGCSSSMPTTMPHVHTGCDNQYTVSGRNLPQSDYDQYGPVGARPSAARSSSESGMVDLKALKEQLRLLGHELPDAQIMEILQDMNITCKREDTGSNRPLSSRPASQPEGKAGGSSSHASNYGLSATQLQNQEIQSDVNNASNATSYSSDKMDNFKLARLPVLPAVEEDDEVVTDTNLDDEFFAACANPVSQLGNLPSTKRANGLDTEYEIYVASGKHFDDGADDDICQSYTKTRNDTRNSNHIRRGVKQPDQGQPDKRAIAGQDDDDAGSDDTGDTPSHRLTAAALTKLGGADARVKYNWKDDLRSCHSNTTHSKTAASYTSARTQSGAPKVDRVARYQQLSQVWNKDRFLKSGAGSQRKASSNFHTQFAALHAAEERQRQQTLKNSRARTKQQLSGAATFVVPSDKRRDELRWQVRMKMNSAPET